MNVNLLNDFIADHIKNFGCIPIEYAEYDENDNETVYQWYSFIEFVSEENFAANRIAF